AADPPETAANRLKMADIVTKEGPEPVAWAIMPKLFAADAKEKYPAVVEKVRQMIMRTSPTAIAAAHRGMAVRPDMTSFLPGIQVPTLVLAGTGDLISPAAEMKEFSLLIPHSQYVEIPNSGHMAPMENPIAVNSAIHKFLGW